MNETVKENMPKTVQSSSCCGAEASLSETTDIRDNVKEFYAQAAQDSSCCKPKKDFYEDSLLANLPDEIANFSLGCGNPITAAELQPGDTVLDLGSGGGLDCFLAAKQVGEEGKVIGIDMTQDMLDKANQNAAKMRITNVEFRKGFLEDMPVEDNAIDVVISNCVVNLSPDKDKVFKEIMRVLKPGGRISISDILVNGALPDHVLADKEAWSACVSGALKVEAYKSGLEKAGMTNLKIQAKGNEILLDNLPENSVFSALISGTRPL